MSTASEHRAWRGSRPASISRPSVPQSRSTVVSPTASGASTPTRAAAKQDNSKPLATTKPVEQTSEQHKQTPAPVPSGNIWDQRKAAAQQAHTASATGHRDVKQTPAQGKKTDAALTSTTRPTASEESHSQSQNHTPVNNFNSAQVRSLLARDTSSSKAYQVQDVGAANKQTPGTKGTMANGQSFFAHLSKQIAQLQASK